MNGHASTSIHESDEGLDEPQELEAVQGFTHPRHQDPIVGMHMEDLTWRMKERMKTVSVALVLCLNVGVDPPDIIKTQPCAKLEAWQDPLATAAQKALEAIGSNLQKQYERWQPRARYKQSLDPTVEEVKKLCTSLRRNAKDERVLFHYNGHGVPKPTVNGEIWVFNRTYTQYIPLSLYDLQQWMGAPAIYVYDCSGAGLIVESFKQFAVQHEREYEIASNIAAKNSASQDADQTPLPPQTDFKKCIQLGACASDQILPMNPCLPADLFTSCLTTPIKVALKWFIMHNSAKLLPGITLENLEKIPGQLTDRRTMLGELNWIFTAITDTIAWNVLPQKLFQRLFRQDLLVASLFRNFLLADRVMRSFNCTPVSNPRLPSTCHHPMWQAWDLAVDICLSQLPKLLEDPGAQYHHSLFFSEQLTAFQVWLSMANHSDTQPEQLPIVLQVLLSQVHRLRALDLLGGFLDLGPWAVHMALSVGIFPYVLKLLQSSARELRPLLVFIWAKILAVDGSCQIDLVRDGGHKYFLNLLTDSYIPSEHRAMAAFVMACIVRKHQPGQKAALEGNLIATCLEQLNDPHPLLRRWLALCLGLTWEGYDSARWCGVRDSAHEKLYSLLDDSEPEVRAAAVFALGTFINSGTERSDHATMIDHAVSRELIRKTLYDGSPLVRKELVVALQWFILLFESQFTSLLWQVIDDQDKGSPRQPNDSLQLGTSPTPNSLRKVPSRDRLMKLINYPFANLNINNNQLLGEAVSPPLARSSSFSSLSFASNGITGVGSVYVAVWNAIAALAADPFPDVATMAQSVIKKIYPTMETFRNDDHYSASTSPSNYNSSPPNSHTPTPSRQGRTDSGRDSGGDMPRMPPQFTRKRLMFGREPSISEDGVTNDATYSRKPLVNTEFFNWCARHFCDSFLKLREEDPESDLHQQKEWRTIRNLATEKAAKEELRRIDPSRMDHRVFLQKINHQPSLVTFHPYEPHLIVTERDHFSVYDTSSINNVLLGRHSNANSPTSRLTSLQLINPKDQTLLMTGCDDGSVRVWSGCHHLYRDKEKSQLKLVTAFQVFYDLPPLSSRNKENSNTILHWDQESSQLVAGGDAKFLRIWDADRETKVCDLSTGADCGVTSLTSDGANLLCAGCHDGSIRLFDKRLQSSESRVITFREHEDPIVGAHIFPDQEKHISVLSGSINGEVRFWDKRILSSIKFMQISQSMSSMAVHPDADIFACGVSSVQNHTINVYTLDGLTGSVISQYDGPWALGQKLSAVNCLSFHPIRVSLAAGSVDNHLSVYAARP